MQTRMEEGRGLPRGGVMMKRGGMETDGRRESLKVRGANENISCYFNKSALKDPYVTEFGMDSLKLTKLNLSDDIRRSIYDNV